MASLRARHLLILLLASFVRSNRVRKPESDDTFTNALREASNQMNSDTLDLPANASSIRENITDTFSCQNRTYGYYADVDNDCQVFHVCLPSQTPGGRNVTYRWSFICPNETVFNQAVLTCTRPADSIDCKDSPDFYHLNMELGKESNKTEGSKDKKDNRKIQKRKQEKRNENIEMINADNYGDNMKGHFKIADLTSVENRPIMIESIIEENVTEDVEKEKESEEEMNRKIMEKNMRNMRKERKIKRGTFRFTGDV